jgi:hypothetical protein
MQPRRETSRGSASGLALALLMGVAVVPLLAGCGGGGGQSSNAAQAFAAAAPPSGKGVQVGATPLGVQGLPADPSAKASHGKGIGRQAKLNHQKVCPPGQAKRGAIRCTSEVATDKNGTPLTFAKPDAYSVPGVIGTVWAFGPRDFHTAYSLPWYTKYQQTIGIVIWADDPTVKSDLDVFDSAFALGSFPSCTTWAWTACFLKVNQRGVTSGFPAVDPRVSLETSLDVQYTHAICLNCRIILVEADSNDNADLAAAENMAYRLGATEINNSWGAPEGDDTCAELTSTYAGAFNHPGVAVVASSGDDGYGTQCPADMNTVVAVGGTDLWQNADLSYSYETVYDDIWGAPGSGCSDLTTARSFQTAAAGWSQTGCGSARGIADVSASYGGAWIYDSTAAYDNDPFDPAATNSHWYAEYGTSLAAPIISATYALAANGWSVSYPAQFAYQHPGSFHDITSGSNGYCSTPICAAGQGYDGPTGLGSPFGLGGF